MNRRESFKAAAAIIAGAALPEVAFGGIAGGGMESGFLVEVPGDATITAVYWVWKNRPGEVFFVGTKDDPYDQDYLRWAASNHRCVRVDWSRENLRGGMWKKGYAGIDPPNC